MDWSVVADQKEEKRKKKKKEEEKEKEEKDGKKKKKKLSSTALSPVVLSPRQESAAFKAAALAGKPAWYRSLWDPKDRKIKLTTRQRVAPYVLKLSWFGYPLYYSRTVGWCFYVPKDRVKEDSRLTGIKYKPIVDKDMKLDCSTTITSISEEEDTMQQQQNQLDHLQLHLYSYFRIPHPSGQLSTNCGNPLSKSYLAHFEAGVLQSSVDATVRLLRLVNQSTYWIGSRQRVSSQMIAWETDHQIDLGLRSSSSSPSSSSDSSSSSSDSPSSSSSPNLGVILPRTIVMGTVTRRAVEPLWMTAANAKPQSIGTELKSKVVAPPGYVFVGADVDSQELWIAALLGDAIFGIHGASPLGFMTLQGNKADKTDMHSVTAGILGISRDNAKVFNYARIYGAGIKYELG